MHARVGLGTTYPEFADGLVPPAFVPSESAGRNRMMRRMIIDDLKLHPGWRGGDYTKQPPGLRAALRLLFRMTIVPLV